MIKVLISAPYMLKEKEKIEKLISNLDGYSFTWAEVQERLEEKDLLEILPKYDSIICGDDKFTEKVYINCPNLKSIVKWGTGIDSINIDIAKKYNVKVFNTLDAFTDPVADSTLGYILNFARNIYLNSKVVKSNEWYKPQGFALFEKTVGIVGFGNIGKAVYKRLKPFGCKILINDLDSEKYQNHEANKYKASLNQIYENCDIITFHCDLNDSSYHLFNESTLDLNLRSPLLINTARGPIISEDALTKGLDSKIISGAALDVFENEPLPSTSKLRNYENVFLAAHNSNSSKACWDKVHKNSIAMLKQGFNND